MKLQNRNFNIHMSKMENILPSETRVFDINNGFYACC